MEPPDATSGISGQNTEAGTRRSAGALSGGAFNGGIGGAEGEADLAGLLDDL